jgi:hypothetical protein
VAEAAAPAAAAEGCGRQEAPAAPAVEIPVTCYQVTDSVRSPLHVFPAREFEFPEMRRGGSASAAAAPPPSSLDLVGVRSFESSPAPSLRLRVNRGFYHRNSKQLVYGAVDRLRLYLVQALFS